MRIHLVVDTPCYESMTIVAAYADRAMAERRAKKMQQQKERWLERQRKLETEGSDDAYATNAPHCYDDLSVASYTLISTKRIAAA